MSPKRIVAATALLAIMSRAAFALDLFTPSSQAPDGAIIRCSITNVGTNPIGVTSTIKGQDGSDITNSSNCYGNPAILDPGKVCFAESAIPGSKSGYCHFTATSSKVRGALLIVSTNGVTSGFAATK